MKLEQARIQIEQALEKGVAEGIEKEKNIATEKFAIRLLNNKVNIKLISRYTGLTEKEIVELRSNL